MAPGVFEHQAGAGQDGHSRFVAPTPEGDLESSGPRGSGHGSSQRSTPLGRRGPDQRNRSGAGPAQRTQPGLGWECAKISAPLSPPPRPHAQAHPPSPSLGCPGSPSAPGPGQAVPGLVLVVFGGGLASAGWCSFAGPAPQVQHAPQGEVRPVGLTCRSE